MKAEHLHIIQHSLGCDSHGRTEHRIRDEGDGAHGYYRNRYVSDPDANLEELCALGLLKDHGAYTIAGGMHYYRVTLEGVKAMKEHSSPPPKVSRDRRRYLAFLAADCSLKFGEWLKRGHYKEINPAS